MACHRRQVQLGRNLVVESAPPRRQIVKVGAHLLLGAAILSPHLQRRATTLGICPQPLLLSNSLKAPHKIPHPQTRIFRTTSTSSPTGLRDKKHGDCDTPFMIFNASSSTPHQTSKLRNCDDYVYVTYHIADRSWQSGHWLFSACPLLIPRCLFACYY